MGQIKMSGFVLACCVEIFLHLTKPDCREIVRYLYSHFKYRLRHTYNYDVLYSCQWCVYRWFSNIRLWDSMYLEAALWPGVRPKDKANLYLKGYGTFYSLTFYEDNTSYFVIPFYCIIELKHNLLSIMIRNMTAFISTSLYSIWRNLFFHFKENS